MWLYPVFWCRVSFVPDTTLLGHLPQSPVTRWLWWVPLALPLTIPSGYHLPEGPVVDADPAPSLAPALPRCFCVPVTGGGTHLPLFRASSPRPSRLLLCLERCTGSSFARRSKDRTRRCVARPSRTAAPQLRVESVWSSFVTACPCHPHSCHRVCPPGWLMSGASPEDTGGSLVASLVLCPGVRLRDCGPFSQTLILYHGLRPSICPSVWVGRAVSDLPDSQLGVFLLLGIPVCKDKPPAPS